MLRLFALALCVVSVSACGTRPFTPSEYPLRDGLIASFEVSGTVAVSNSQTSSDPVIVYSYGGSKLSSDLKSITEVMVQQTNKELEKNGRVIGGGASKTISLRVDSLLSKYTNAFFWKSNIKFQAVLGDGQTLDFTVPHTSGVLAQDLNGCIAEGVMTLLNDHRVKSYLAS